MGEEKQKTKIDLTSAFQYVLEYICRFSVFAIDVFVLLFLLAHARDFLKQYVFAGRTAEESLKLLSAIPSWLIGPTWVILILVVILLFRDGFMAVFYQLPGFVQRSRFDNSVKSDDCPIDHSNDEKAIADTCAAKTDKGSGKKKSTLNFSMVEQKVFTMLQAQFATTFIRPAVVNGCMRFDGAFKRGGITYVVEIKCISSLETLHRICTQTTTTLAAASSEQQARMIVVLCLLADWKKLSFEEAERTVYSHLGNVILKRIDFDQIEVEK